MCIDSSICTGMHVLFVRFAGFATYLLNTLHWSLHFVYRKWWPDERPVVGSESNSRRGHVLVNVGALRFGTLPSFMAMIEVLPVHSTPTWSPWCCTGNQGEKLDVPPATAFWSAVLLMLLQWYTCCHQTAWTFQVHLSCSKQDETSIWKAQPCNSQSFIGTKNPMRDLHLPHALQEWRLDFDQFVFSVLPHTKSFVANSSDWNHRVLTVCPRKPVRKSGTRVRRKPRRERVPTPCHGGNLHFSSVIQHDFMNPLLVCFWYLRWKQHCSAEHPVWCLRTWPVDGRPMDI